jgi:hypothetical protein
MAFQRAFFHLGYFEHPFHHVYLYIYFYLSGEFCFPAVRNPTCCKKFQQLTDLVSVGGRSEIHEELNIVLLKRLAELCSASI